MELKDKIVILRKARHFSQQELGDRLGKSTFGISRQSIYDWEKGNSEPKLDNLRELATVLNVSFDVLLDETCDLSDQVVLQKVLLGTYNSSSGDIELPKVNIEIRRRFILPHVCVSFFLVSLLALIIAMSYIYGFSLSEAPALTLTTIIGKIDELTKTLILANSNLMKIKTLIIFLIIPIPLFFIGGILLIKIPSSKVVGYFDQNGISFKEKRLTYIPLSLIQEISIEKNVVCKNLIVKSSQGQHIIKNIIHPEIVQYSFDDLKNY